MSEVKEITLRQLIVKNLEQSRRNEILIARIAQLETDESVEKGTKRIQASGFRGELELTLDKQEYLHDELQKLLYQLAEDKKVEEKSKEE